MQWSDQGWRINMQTKRGDKSLLLFVCMAGKAFSSYFVLLFFVPLARQFFLFCYMASIYLRPPTPHPPVSLPAPFHHQYRPVSYLPPGSPQLRGNWRSQRGVHSLTHTHRPPPNMRTHTQVYTQNPHLCIQTRKVNVVASTCKDGAACSFCYILH